MATQKKKVEEHKPVAPPVKKPQPVQKEGCDPLPAKDGKKDTNRPPCPEGYQDRQPTTPPDEDPEQRPH